MIVRRALERNDKVVGHYTQLLWAKTRAIGCGFSRFIYANNFISNYLICNYGPAGNIIEQPVYEIAQSNIL